MKPTTNGRRSRQRAFAGASEAPAAGRENAAGQKHALGAEREVRESDLPGPTAASAAFYARLLPTQSTGFIATSFAHADVASTTISRAPIAIPGPPLQNLSLPLDPIDEAERIVAPEPP